VNKGPISFLGWVTNPELSDDFQPIIGKESAKEQVQDAKSPDHDDDDDDDDDDEDAQNTSKHGNHDLVGCCMRTCTDGEACGKLESQRSSTIDATRSATASAAIIITSSADGQE